ncbi:hypothetical protein L6452_02986 [Arctium lappa]|uniref:Uncharacterized protein n=1 Tax=Arctium lappa TaxID=4217 RepID=A0ACB9FL40_ARCLA|nr:hypothetical protein L6452_02986 [Arctium lappa]
MPTTDERGNTVLSARDVAVRYMPEIPSIEAERDKLKDQNSALLKQIQEFKSKLLNSDKTFVCAKCIDHSKSILQASEFKVESVDLHIKCKAFEEKISDLETKNADLMKNLQEDKDKTNLEKDSTQKLSDFSKKAIQEKKDLELRCLKLSKQVSEFEKIFCKTYLKKKENHFNKRKKSFEMEKKNAEKRNIGIFKEISQKTKNMEKDFEQERLNFESKISKLTSKISVLSSDIQKEQMARTDLKKKFDTISDERNILSKKIKYLKAINVELSEKISADVINQSPLDNST